MTRRTQVTLSCDGRIPHKRYRPGQSFACCKRLVGVSHVAVTKLVARYKWRETPEGVVTCDECLVREKRGESITRTEHDA